MLRRPNLEDEKPLPTIEVICVTRVPNGGNLRARATVRVGKVLIHDWRIVQQNRQKPYAQSPQRVWLDKGELRYGGPLIEFPAEVDCAIKKCILSAWARETGEIWN